MSDATAKAFLDYSTPRCICALGHEPTVTQDADGYWAIAWPNGKQGRAIPMTIELVEGLAAEHNARHAEIVEFRRRQQALLDALDTDRSTTIPKRVVRAILKGR